MIRVNLADAKAHLGQLVDRAAAGERFASRAVASRWHSLTAVTARRKRIDIAALKAATDAMPVQPETARDFIRRMRNEDRY